MTIAIMFNKGYHDLKYVDNIHPTKDICKCLKSEYNKFFRSCYKMINLKDIQRARQKIVGIIKQTPIITSEQLSLRCDNEIFLKSEHLQTTGSFKIRGATNKV